jgi:hypothetical protein
VKSADAGVSLKTVLHFLLEHDVHWAALRRYRHLIGRYVNLHMSNEYRNGRKVPIILGFSFNTRELFSYNGRTGRPAKKRQQPRGGRRWQTK